MNGTVLDILLYVFDRYMFDEAPEVPEREALARHLASAGFGEDNVERALDWLADLAGLRHAGDRDARLDALAGLLGVEREDLDAESLEAVFGDYYETGANSAPLEMFADMLELLVTGELLSDESTALLLGHMRAISTGGRRIQAGLPSGTDFAQKTGTQIERACNVGVINPEAVEEGATIVVACAEDYGDLGEAERAFQALGRALAEANLT